MFKIIYLLTLIVSGTAYSNGAATNLQPSSIISEKATNEEDPCSSRLILEMSIAYDGGSFFIQCLARDMDEDKVTFNMLKDMIRIKRHWLALMKLIGRELRPEEDKDEESLFHVTILMMSLRGYHPLNITDKDGNTALILAAKSGRMGIAQTLVENGADMGVQNKDGDTALMVAEKNNYADIVQLLKQKSAAQ